MPELRVRGASPAQGSLTPQQRNARLRMPRTRSYVDAVSRLDAGNLRSDPAALEALVATVRAQFDELGIPEYPIGLVQNCCLGRPYEVHVLDLQGGVVKHYREGEAMPDGFEQARSLALHPTFRAEGLIPTYAFIEVFRDSVNPVRAESWAPSNR